jgi:hypothetical protein
MCEAARLIAIDTDVWERSFADSAARAIRALARFRKHPHENRREAWRYESLCRDLESLARSIARRQGREIWLGPEDLGKVDAAISSERHPWSMTLGILRRIVPGAVSQIPTRARRHGHVRIARPPSWRRSHRRFSC